MTLGGQVAVVTGASQGIGEAVARLFAERGMRLVLADMTGDVGPVAETIAGQFPSSEAVGLVIDVSDETACDTLVEATVAKHGLVDVLAHATASPQRMGRVMSVNAKGAFLLCRSVVPASTKPGGAIVFAGSFTGEAGPAERAAYSASKGALRLFTQSSALELAGVGVRVNGVAPAFVESAMGRQGLEATAADEGISVDQARPHETCSSRLPSGHGEGGR